MSTLFLLVLVLGAMACLLIGILLGRYYVPDDRMLRRSAKHARSYIRTTTLALAGDHDGAFEELREVVIADNIADIEPYFALGALLRARGEWAQAVRVHESLRLRLGLTKKEYLRTTYELGLDYFHAGMPRRAIAEMEQCLSQDSKHEGALRALCRLYEVTGRYADAARCFRELRRIGKGLKEEEEALVHHLLCAAASAAIPDDLDAAKRHLREAQKSGQESEHALLVMAELAMARSDHEDAIAALREALALRPDLEPQLVPMLMSALMAQRAGKRPRASTRADQRAETIPGLSGLPGMTDAIPGMEAAHDLDTAKAAVEILVSVRESIPPSGYLDLAIAELRSLYDGVAALEEYRQAAAAYPELLAARVAAARLALDEGDSGSIRRELEALAGPEGALLWALSGTWRCSACGHREESMFWRCNECESWGTVRRDVGTIVREVVVKAPGLPARLLTGSMDLALLGAKLAREDRALRDPSSTPAVSTSALSASALSASASSLFARVGSWFGRSTTPASPPKRPALPPAERAALPPRSERSAALAAAQHAQKRVPADSAVPTEPTTSALSSIGTGTDTTAKAPTSATDKVTEEQPEPRPSTADSV